MSPLLAALRLPPFYFLSTCSPWSWGLLAVIGGEQGILKAPTLSKPLRGSTNPFPNLSLVSMGQDVDVWLQGAGFDDHLVPGVGWRWTQLTSLPRVGPERLQRVISLWAAVPTVSNGFNGPPAWVQANTMRA